MPDASREVCGQRLLNACVDLVHATSSLHEMMCWPTSMSWGPFTDVYLHSTWNTPTVKPMHLTAATLSWHSSLCWCIGRMLGQFEPAQHLA